MSDLVSDPAPALPFVTSVVHPTDFSEASNVAFAHALAVALIRQTSFFVLHVGHVEAENPWIEFPGVRGTLTRWGLLGEDAPRSAVFDEFKVRVTKVAVRARDPVEGVEEFLREHQVDLMVLATEGREGLPRWMRRSTAERLARASATMTLFVPAGVPGFVDPGTGRTSLRRILVPIDHAPDPTDAVVVATRLARGIGDPPVEIVLLHVGDGAAPAPPCPGDEAWRFVSRHDRGDPVDAILRAAAELSVDAVVMATAGRDGIVDALRGSVTERVLRGAPCPLLAVPAR